MNAKDGRPPNTKQARDALGRFARAPRAVSPSRAKVVKAPAKLGAGFRGKTETVFASETARKGFREQTKTALQPRDELGRFRPHTLVRKLSRPKPLKPPPSSKPPKGSPTKPLRGPDGRFLPKPKEITTADRRKSFYKELTAEEKAALELRAKLSPAKAYAAIRKIIFKLSDHFNAAGIAAIPAVVLNADGTVDGDLMIHTTESFVEAPEGDGLSVVEDLVMAIPRIVKTINSEIWFSNRAHFDTPEPVDENDDPVTGTLTYDVITPSLVDDSYLLSEQRWQTFVIQTAWQHSKEKLYSNFQGILAAAENTLRKHSHLNPIVSAITFKLAWNPQNITPPKTR